MLFLLLLRLLPQHQDNTVTTTPSQLVLMTVFSKSAHAVVAVAVAVVGGVVVGVAGVGC